MKAQNLHLPTLIIAISFALQASPATAQTHTCPVMVNRNNGNGGSNSCAGVNGTATASSVNGTSFAFVPAGSKTADITLKGNATDPWYTNPPAIYVVYTTSGSTTTAVNTYPGPPSAPSSGNVKYCSYTGSSGNGNMPNAGIVSFRFVTPTNTSDYLVCSYDFSSSNSQVANPTTIVALPVHFYKFDANVANRSVNLTWTTSRDRNTNNFTVERSVNGSDFTTLSVIPAGTADGDDDIASFSYEDYTAGSSNSYRLYYRIRETDFSGVITYSPVSTVTLADEGKELDMAVQGNMLVIKSTGAAAMLQYINIEGRVIREEKTSLNNGVTSMNLDNVEGISFIRLVTGSQTAVCRL